MHDRANKGDDWAIDRLLSRPTLSSDAAPFWSAFLGLSRDRPHESISLGMGGSLTIPRPVPREAIRREGHRLYYRGGDLEDFTEIVARIDDIYVELAVKRSAEEAKMAAARAKKR